MTEFLRQHRAFVIGGLVAVIMGLPLLFYYGRKEPRRTPAPKLRPVTQPLAMPESRAPVAAGLEPEEELEEDRLFGGSLALAEGDLTFEEYMEMVAAAAEQPQNAAATQAVLDELKANPGIGRVLGEFKSRVKRGERPAASDFLKALRKLPDFAKLVEKLLKNPAASSALWKFYKQPELASPARQHLPVILGRGAPKPGAPSLVAPAQSGLSQAQSRAGSGRLSGTRAPSRFAAGASSQADASESAGSPSGTTRTAAFSSSGPDAHEVGTLDKSFLAFSGKTQQRVEIFCGQYPPFCEGTPPALRAEFRSLMDGRNLIERFGLWGACMSADIYAQCEGSCRGGCVRLDAWTSCQDAELDTQTCIAKAVAAGQGDAIPSSIWEGNCVVCAPGTIPSFCGDRGELRNCGGAGATLTDTGTGTGTGTASGSATGTRTASGTGTSTRTGTRTRTGSDTRTLTGTATGTATATGGGCYQCSVACMTPNPCPVCGAGRWHGACQNDFFSRTRLTGSRQCAVTTPAHATCTGTVNCGAINPRRCDAQ